MDCFFNLALFANILPVFHIKIIEHESLKANYLTWQVKFKKNKIMLEIQSRNLLLFSIFKSK